MTGLGLATWVGVLALGGLAAIARFLIDSVISIHFGRDFPLGTLAINISGACLLGLLDGLMLTGNALVLAGTATLGSYTTFSTWMLETHRLREDGELMRALANSAISLLLGLGSVTVGHKLGVSL
jgi:CrcB protein